MALRLVWPTIATTGTWSSLASYRPLSRWMAPGPGGGHADADPAGELGVADRLERGHLLVPGLDELRLVIGPAPGGQDPVDPVARDSRTRGARPSRAAARAENRQPSVPSIILPPSVLKQAGLASRLLECSTRRHYPRRRRQTCRSARQPQALPRRQANGPSSSAGRRRARPGPGGPRRARARP